MSIPTIEQGELLILENEERFSTNRIVEEEIDKSKKAHFVSPSMNFEIWNFMGLPSVGGVEGTRQLVQYAISFRLELVALCGYRWVPTAEPSSQDTCEDCLTIAGSWISEDEG